MEKKEKGKKIRHMLVKILIILIALGIASYCATLGFLCVQEGKVPKEASELETDYDAVVVLGAQVKPDGEPSVQLSLRLDRAAEVWSAAPRAGTSRNPRRIPCSGTSWTKAFRRT